MLYVYAAVEPGRPVPDMAGVDGAPVALVAAGEVSLAVSTLEAELSPTRERLLRHYRVNMALLGVPFRFGNTAPDERRLRELMAPRAQDLAGKLRQVAGCVEMTIKLREAPPPDGTPGRAYLLAKRALYRQGEDVRGKLEGLLRDYREELRRGVLSVACLIPAQGAADVRTRVEGAETSGPWPPSSFV